jgi:hypothetical protein
VISGFPHEFGERYAHLGYYAANIGTLEMELLGCPAMSVGIGTSGFVITQKKAVFKYPVI